MILSRVGWAILLLILAAGALFASMLRFGPGAPHRAPVARPTAAGDSLPVDVAAPGALMMPVAGVQRATLSDSWGDARDGGARGHTGLDIMAPGGTPTLATVDGRIEKLWKSAAGGNTIYLRSLDRGWTFYYAHLAGYASGLHEGQVVRAGERIGYVGDTGNAGAGNTHLHFGVTRMRPDEGWWQGKPIDPYPLLARP